MVSEVEKRGMQVLHFKEGGLALAAVVESTGFAPEKSIARLLVQIGDFCGHLLTATIVGAYIIGGGEKAVVVMAGAGNWAAVVGLLCGERLGGSEDGLFERRIPQHDHTVGGRVFQKMEKNVTL